ncbi:hypothetical protein F511_27421 [Dorcoceras hygrometricum]|uniref:Uncharacterized protein n=1 Tax=Dorcoceras hygrometricum TaxID=472368 RepID=A0A2Z7AJ33_9LAMI|nr:hypothetical protein F511_27421 [Dorcoceras hygrometricum]
MGRTLCCEKTGLNKGKWTAEEDEKLITYIKENGQGSWRSLPKNAGLLRCGKSCRLRWMNYLRDDVKRGNFSAQEEETIVKLHKTLGNKWSLIASHLPGRTDNEIKNYWNSHLSRRIYRYRSIGALTEADLIELMVRVNKRRATGVARGVPKKFPAVEKHANMEMAGSDSPTGGANVGSTGTAEDEDWCPRDPFENDEMRGVNTSTASLYGTSELFVSPNEVMEGEDFGLWDGLDDGVLMHVELISEGCGVGDKSEDEDMMIIDKDLKGKGTVNEKECGDWWLDIENMGFHACFSPTIPYYNDEGIRWEANSGGEEFNLWNLEMN